MNLLEERGNWLGGPCFIEDCPYDGVNEIAIRCRVKIENGLKNKTNAVWAPDMQTFLCNEHALSGGVIAMLYDHRDGQGDITTRISNTAGRTIERTTRIRL